MKPLIDSRSSERFELGAFEAPSVRGNSERTDSPSSGSAGSEPRGSSLSFMAFLCGNPRKRERERGISKWRD